jgi:hypothetical protein
MKKQRIYLSGKISGLQESEARLNFEYYANKASEMFAYPENVIIINPFDIRPFLGIKTWFCYMLADIYELSMCDTIFMQPNWTESRGAVIEYFFAKFIFKITVIKP